MASVGEQQKVFDVKKIRKDFPILDVQVKGKPLVYFDNGATTQKPQVVIDRINRYYSSENANVHRGVHHLSDYCTNEYERSREIIRKYLNASSIEEVIFTKGTTDAINLVASSYGRTNVKKGDEVLISALEHHSNIVPWQMLCEEKGAVLKVVPVNDKGELLMEEFEKLLTEKTKIVAVNYISNSLGTINPVKKIIELAHAKGVPVLLDAAQAVQHTIVDVQKLGCDFLTFSGHKAYGPTGIGVLYGKKEILESMPPYQGGGDMIKTVTFEKTTYNDLPLKFEAGTPNIAGSIALGTALEYLQSVGLEGIIDYEHDLLEYATGKLQAIEGLRIIGTAEKKTSILSTVIDGVHPFDLGTMLDAEGIAIRTGHHCTQPLMDRFNIPGTARVSLAMYNTKEEIDFLIEVMNKTLKILR